MCSIILSVGKDLIGMFIKVASNTQVGGRGRMMNDNSNSKDFHMCELIGINVEGGMERKASTFNSGKNRQDFE